MLTRRGWWFLIAVLGLLLLGALANFMALAVVALGLLIWFSYEGLSFAIRARFVVPDLRVVREVRDDHGRAATLWAGRRFQARFGIESKSNYGLPYLVVTEFVPFGIKPLSAPKPIEGALEPGEKVYTSYRFRSPTVGRVRFEGVSLQLADLQGFFYYRTFLADPTVYRVLPPLLDRKGVIGVSKNHNILPPPGIHRLRRPGTGSELLNLRDYLAGDPPKTIAWKVSARRGRLITKEYESEVPVRCTVFLDTSQSVRLGPPQSSQLISMVELTAMVVQANTRSRDLTGLCLFDEKGVDNIAPARDSAHVSRVLNVLADAAALSPRSTNAPPDELVNLAFSFVNEVKPNLIDSQVNKIPLLMPWQGTVRNTQKGPGCFGYLGRILFFGLAFLVYIGQAILYFTVLESINKQMEQYRDLSQHFAKPPATFNYVLLGVGAIFYIRFANAFRRALPQIFSNRRRNHVRRRKHVSAILSVEHKLMPGGLARLQEDDQLLSAHLQEFLAAHRVPYSLPLYDDNGRYQFSSPSKVQILAKAILRAIAAGHDNELFVLAVDLLELDDHLDPLLKAVGVALARQHQVILVMALPPGYEMEESPVAIGF
ncbi:MAG TPA: DUF58 domain-containing protein, partial [Gemmataceae bacterium]|nr:DUF58 domain-containing protein [Gemmataceae bacterium]